MKKKTKPDFSFIAPEDCFVIIELEIFSFIKTMKSLKMHLHKIQSWIGSVRRVDEEKPVMGDLNHL